MDLFPWVGSWFVGSFVGSLLARGVVVLWVGSARGDGKSSEKKNKTKCLTFFGFSKLARLRILSK